MDLLLNEMNNIFSLNGCGDDDDDDVTAAANKVETAAITPWTVGARSDPLREKLTTTNKISYDSTTNEYRLNGSAAPFYLKKSSNNETYCFPLDDSARDTIGAQSGNGFRIVRSDPSNAEFPFLVENDTDLAPGIVRSQERLFIDTSLINYKSGATLQNLFIVGPWLPGNAAPSSGYSTLKFVVNSTGTAPSTIHAGTITYSATGGPGRGPIYYLTPPGGTASSISRYLKKGIIYTFTIDASAQNANRFRITTDRPTYISGVFQNTGYPAYAELDSDVGPGITPGPITATSTTLTIDTTQINYPSGSTEREIFLIGPVSASTSGSDAPSSGQYTTWPFKINAAGTN